MFLFGLFGVGYVAKLKYNANKAEEKLKDIELEIAKTDVQVTKKVAEAEAKSIEIQTKAKQKILEDLIKKKEEIKNEMIEIRKKINQYEKKKEKKEQEENIVKTEAFEIEI